MKLQIMALVILLGIGSAAQAAPAWWAHPEKGMPIYHIDRDDVSLRHPDSNIVYPPW